VVQQKEVTRRDASEKKKKLAQERKEMSWSPEGGSTKRDPLAKTGRTMFLQWGKGTVVGQKNKKRGRRKGPGEEKKGAEYGGDIKLETPSKRSTEWLKRTGFRFQKKV